MEGHKVRYGRGFGFTGALVAISMILGGGGSPAVAQVPPEYEGYLPSSCGSVRNMVMTFTPAGNGAAFVHAHAGHHVTCLGSSELLTVHVYTEPAAGSGGAVGTGTDYCNICSDRWAVTGEGDGGKDGEGAIAMPGEACWHIMGTGTSTGYRPVVAVTPIRYCNTWAGP